MSDTKLDTERCQHPNFLVKANVARLTDTDGGHVTGFDASVMINCSECGMPFQWLGLEMGSSPFKPMMSANHLELRAPITPEEEL